jgi:hypothetical protein
MDVHSDDKNINLDDHLIEYKGFDIVFEQPFLDKYPIINKNNGIKNLRCFPCCTSPFHSKQGFCGQSVNIRLFFYRYVTFIHTFINTCVHTYIHAYIHANKYSYTHTYINSYIHTYLHAYIHTYILTYIKSYIHEHTYIHTHIQTNIHSFDKYKYRSLFRIYIILPWLHSVLHYFIHSCTTSSIHIVPHL